MMRTACPLCSTVFRVTPEQLRVRAGKVRCGQCQGVFNALESLMNAPLPEVQPPAPGGFPPPTLASLESPEPAGSTAEDLRQAAPPVAKPDAASAAIAVDIPAAHADESPAAHAEAVVLTEAESPGEEPESKADPAHPPESTDETPEESAQAAREAGLAAARELAETPGFSRWSAGALAADSLGGLVAEAPRRLVWPFLLAALILLVVLAAQFAYHWRTEIAQRLPAALGAYDALGIPVPLPRVADLVSIEASDLQADAARGLLILSANLRNRAPFPQSWPALELTLTDAQDAVVARRVLAAADYLPPQADPAAFAPGSDTAVKLWIDAREAGAAGYRLYVFYS